VEIPGSHNSSKPKAWSVLAIALVAAICALLVLAASANAETVGETVETAAAGEAPPAPAEPVQTAPVVPAPVPEPAPAETLEAPSAGGTAELAPEGTPVAPVVESLPVPKSTTAPSAPSPLPQASGAEQAVQKLARDIGEGSAGPATPVTEATKAVAQGALDAIGPAAGEALLRPVELLPEPATGPMPDALSLPQPPLPSSSFSRPLTGASPLRSPVELGGIETIAADSGVADLLGASATARLSTVAVAAALAGTAVDRTATRAGSPAPLNLPPPAPGSPEAVVPGAGGSLFVPLAALLALLALVAPAALRRVGEVPDFRPPTPFVCALERPG
jgi:hypothetical protein